MLSVDEVGLEAAVGQLAQELEQAGVGCPVPGRRRLLSC